MSEQWVKTTLGEIAEINPEATPKWPADYEIRYVDIASVSATSGINLAEVGAHSFGKAPGRARRRIRAGDVLVSTVRPNLRSFAVVPKDLDGEVASTGFAVLRAKPSALPGFIWSLVQSEAFVEDMVGRCTGSNYPAVRADDVAAFPVSLPPLPVQRRIVDLLAHLDNHLLNLRAEERALRSLLDTQAQCIFTAPSDRQRFAEVAVLQRGFDLPVQSRRAGDVPVVASNGLVGTHDVAKVAGPGVVTGRSGTIGKVMFVESGYWPLNTTLYVKDFKGNHPRFVRRLLESMDLEGHAGGSTVPSLNRNVLDDVSVVCPSLAVQIAVAD